MELGRVIAQRVLEQGGTTIRISIGEPRTIDGAGAGYVCPYRFEPSDGSEAWSGFAAGVDSVQALIFALTKIGDALAHDEGGDVTFLGTSSLGFPITQPSDGTRWTARVSSPTSADEASS